MKLLLLSSLNTFRHPTPANGFHRFNNARRYYLSAGNPSHEAYVTDKNALLYSARATNVTITLTLTTNISGQPCLAS